MRRVLVTGGAGFIGSCLVRHLLEDGNTRVLNVDLLTYAGRIETLADVTNNPLHTFLQADIADAQAMRSAFQEFQPDHVIHLAAESHVDRSIEGPSAFVHTNVMGTVSLLDAALEFWRALCGEKRDQFRFLHVSTDEVFGSLKMEGGFDEQSQYKPNSPYSASKASSDHFVRAWYRTYGLPTLISNCSNNYGPYQFPEKLIPVVILAALEGRQIPVYGKGLNVRDWLYVKDHVSALLAITHLGRVGEVYCIGGDNEISNINLVESVCELMDELTEGSKHIPHANLIQFVSDRPGHDYRYAINSKKLREELGWRPSVCLKDGLRATVKWYLENQNWWEPIISEGRKRRGLAKEF